MGLMVGCAAFGPVGIVVGIGGLFVMGAIKAIQAANRNDEVKQSILEQQKNGEKDSSEVEDYLRIGRVGKYKE